MYSQSIKVLMINIQKTISKLDILISYPKWLNRGFLEHTATDPHWLCIARNIHQFEPTTWKKKTKFFVSNRITSMNNIVKISFIVQIWNYNEICPTIWRPVRIKNIEQALWHKLVVFDLGNQSIETFRLNAWCLHWTLIAWFNCCTFWNCKHTSYVSADWTDFVCVIHHIHLYSVNHVIWFVWVLPCIDLSALIHLQNKKTWYFVTKLSFELNETLIFGEKKL